MNCTIHEINETKVFYVCVTAKSKEEADKGCNRIGIAMKKCLSEEEWEYKQIGQSLAEEEHHQNYYFNITFFLSSERIDKKIDYPMEELIGA